MSLAESAIASIRTMEREIEQLRADKAGLLEALKDCMRGPMSVAQVNNALNLIAKQEAKP